MERLTTTPFGPRPVTAGLLATIELAKQAQDCPAVDKWALMQDLTAAKQSFGVTDRDLSVLSALLSFHPERELSGDDLIVFPSNASLATRAHGMAESTLRRHLSALVGAGLLLRHDSPNGKRYATRDGRGGILRAYGLDLAPLVVRAGEISERATAAREAATALKLAREKAVIQLRDLRKLLAYLSDEEGLGEKVVALEAQLAQSAKAFRRKMALAHIDAVTMDLDAIHGILLTLFNSLATEKMGGNDDHSERHYHNSKTDTQNIEPSLEKDKVANDPPKKTQTLPPLALVTKSCPEILAYSPDPIRHWRDFVELAALIRPMLGISAGAWQDACDAMGPEAAAISIGYMLERLSEIRSPGGYLRALTERAGQGLFSPGPLVMALVSLRKPAVIGS